MKRSEAFPTKYLSKDDIKAPTVGIIDNVINETLGSGDDQEVKPVMYFKSGIEKPIVINNTNWINVESVYGDDSDNWIGKPIEAWVDPNVSFGGKRIGGLRLREPSNHKQTTPAMSSAEAITAFWAYANGIGYDKEAAKQLVKDNGNDFAAALKVLQAA